MIGEIRGRGILGEASLEPCDLGKNSSWFFWWSKFLGKAKLGFDIHFGTTSYLGLVCHHGVIGDDREYRNLFMDVWGRPGRSVVGSGRGDRRRRVYWLFEYFFPVGRYCSILGELELRVSMLPGLMAVMLPMRWGTWRWSAMARTFVHVYEVFCISVVYENGKGCFRDWSWGRGGEVCRFVMDDCGLRPILIEYCSWLKLVPLTWITKELICFK